MTKRRKYMKCLTNKKKILSFVLVVSIILSLSISAYAYVITYRGGYDDCPAYFKCYNGFSQATLTAVHNSCLSWNRTHSSALAYRNTATHSNTSYPNYNNSNEITKGSRGANKYLMQTTTYSIDGDYSICEADIDINVSHDFGTASTSYDTQTAMTHEMGHALGLGHSSNTSAIMYESLGKGETRNITSDDISGIAAIY